MPAGVTRPMAGVCLPTLDLRRLPLRGCPQLSSAEVARQIALSGCRATFGAPQEWPRQALTPEKLPDNGLTLVRQLAGLPLGVAGWHATPLDAGASGRYINCD